MGAPKIHQASIADLKAPSGWDATHSAYVGRPSKTINQEPSMYLRCKPVADHRNAELQLDKKNNPRTISLELSGSPGRLVNGDGLYRYRNLAKIRKIGGLKIAGNQSFLALKGFYLQ
jgi:hypothetical protein